MRIFRQGEIVKVPFRYTDRATRQRRPAVIISSGDLQDRHGLVWVAMITSAENRPWAGDVTVRKDAGTGLMAPSVVRPAKIATIDARDAEPVGSVEAKALAKIVAQIRGNSDRP
jgi:mRNA interferase MazF